MDKWLQPYIYMGLLIHALKLQRRFNETTTKVSTLHHYNSTKRLIDEVALRTFNVAVASSIKVVH